jgi:hypothetical protein
LWWLASCTPGPSLSKLSPCCIHNGRAGAPLAWRLKVDCYVCRNYHHMIGLCFPRTMISFVLQLCFVTYLLILYRRG